MTTLAIMATYEKKRLKCYGTVAAGEHVAVTVTDGAQWIGEGTALRLRVLFGPATVAVFPFAEGDTWTAAGTQNADAACELNLNTVQAEKYLKHGGTCLWILDDVENHTLYGTGEFDVLPWPKRRGIDEPIDIDGYPLLLDEINGLREEFEAYQRTVSQMLAAKQDAINDLSEIREGASAGASALQPAEILDGGKVKSDLLPSYVDDVLEFASRSAFPATGESGKIYVALDTNRTYRWSGTQYVEIASSPTLDDAVTRTSANGVRSSGIWSAIWGTASTAFASLYDWVVAQLAGKASKADATLTERGFSKWNVVCSNPAVHGVVVYDDGIRKYQLYDSDIPDWLFDETEAIWPEDSATSLQFSYIDGDLTFVATREVLPGYVLGDQDDLPLASEAEAEALRTNVAGKYTKPETGIPKIDLAEGIQASLDKADTAPIVLDVAHHSRITVGDVEFEVVLYWNSGARDRFFMAAQRVGTWSTQSGEWQSSAEAYTHTWESGGVTYTATRAAGNYFTPVYINGVESSLNNIASRCAGQDLGTTAKAFYDTLNAYFATCDGDGNRISDTYTRKASPRHAGNLAALDTSGNPTDSLIPAANVALKGAIPYDRITITTGQLQDHAVQKVTLNAATTTLSLPALTGLSGKIADFGIDMVNGYAPEVGGTPTPAAASFQLDGMLGTDYNLIVPDGETWSEMTKLAPNKMAVYYFTLSAFWINDKPTWEVMKKVVTLVPVPPAP